MRRGLSSCDGIVTISRYDRMGYDADAMVPFTELLIARRSSVCAVHGGRHKLSATVAKWRARDQLPN